MDPLVYPVILAGGASSRLWPVSDARRPKWDLRLFGAQSLLEGAWARAARMAAGERCLVVAGAAHEERIRASLGELPEANLLIEPGLRDTAGAVAFAAGWALRRGPGGALLVLPGDALIEQVDRFALCAGEAVRLGLQEQALVTFGIMPRFAATCYGYIQRGAPLALSGKAAGGPAAFVVRAFKEKPALEVAQGYLRSGEYLWNAGIFLFPLQVLMAELERQLPAHAGMAQALAITRTDREWQSVAREWYPRLEKISVDFGIMEHAGKVCGVAADFDWDDIGSWSAVRDHLEREGGVAVGPGVRGDFLGAEGSVVIAPGRRVALIGVKNVAVVDDPAGLLVCELGQDQQVKAVAQRASQARSFEVQAPSQGRAIDCLLVQPESVGPQTGFLLVFHGFGNNRRQYLPEMERWAAHYDLVCVSPEFRDSGLDVDPAGGSGHRRPYDFSHLQLADGLNAYLLARRRYPQADGGRRFVWGGSQGGHLAVLAAAFAPRTFALAVDCCGIAYLDGKWAQELGPAASEAELAIRDARLWVERIRCPVVLMHGTADPTVPAGQTRELATALARAGKDFTVRYVPGGDHFLRPVTTRAALTEVLAGQPLRELRAEGPDDFEARGSSSFDCPGGGRFLLDFSGGIAEFRRAEA